ncbi:MAG: LexA repressor [candidate division WS6 bacterium GW2011_GWA2_37_6]|uniref:LexA repressor n=1 Tax=candidate division WS6 bacterium GW2011_GWA2_37_6 TaxID=1619087 RepID=A0A0G0H0X3_9BACT|nr:MAG: LexA repressor [candidate division WS6 bacterium GW2011_GWA2_37_6]
MYKSLTKRQRETLDYVTDFTKLKGYSPSLDEIKDHLQLKAISTVHEHLENLRKKGYLTKEINQSRSIEIIDPNLQNSNFLQIQNLGVITAGKRIEAVEDPEPLYVSREVLAGTGKYYALTVRGDSMIEDGIHDGDIVVIREQKTATNGDTIVAIVQENLATLKRFYKEKNRVRLQPANSSLKPSFFREIEIRGKVVSLLRKF